MPRRHAIAVVGSLLTASLLAAAPSRSLAQQPGYALPQPPQPPPLTSPVNPTLDDILLRLENNLRHYTATVPSFFCDEHVLSKVEYEFSVGHGTNTVTNSIFRLRRSLLKDNKVMLTESRDIQTIDGRPAKGDEIKGPALLSGAFSGGLAIVSLNQTSCMRYTLRPTSADHPTDPYIVEFASLPERDRPPDCLLREDGSGRVFVDPATMQVSHMELIAPRHVIVPAGVRAKGRSTEEVQGVWDLTVDYSRVLLGENTFWMPDTVRSTLTSGGVDPVIWTYIARYSNYHKLFVSARILPASPEPPGP